MFIEKLINEYANDGYKKLSEEYEKIEEELTNRCSKGTISSYVQAMASIVLADSLIGRYFFNTDLESSINMGLNILEELPKEEETSDVERAYQLICSWLIQNELKFDRHEFNTKYNEYEDKNESTELLMNRENGDTTEKYGLYEKGYFYILPNKFNEFIEQNQLSPLAVKKQLAELGYIQTQRDKNRTYYEVLKYYNGGRRRMLAFKLEINDILPEEEIEKLDQQENPYGDIGNANVDI